MSYIYLFLLSKHSWFPISLAGVPIRSDSVNVHSRGLCSNPVIPNTYGALGAQSFSAKLEYVEPEAGNPHSNRIHITVEIPHQDGMLPVISTLPIHNINYLLTQSSFTKHHACSSLPNTTDATSNILNSFLTRGSYSADDAASGMRTEPAARLYKHLNRLTCRWRFEGWFDVSSVVDRCGGQVTRNFDVGSASQSFVTVHQPLHVSYIFAKAPTGWASLDHQTLLEFSFYYNNVKFESGVEIKQEPSASVEIIRVGIGADGKMAVQLRSQSHFRGQC